VILGIIALLVIGPEQLPDMAKKLAKLLNELKRAKDEIMSPVEDLRMQAQQAIDETRRKMDEQIRAEMDKINKGAEDIEKQLDKKDPQDG
jgi:Sec-independent protein translocase protein TatA